MTKAISAVIATVMLLMITVSLIGVFYVFSSTLATQTTGAGGQQASQLTAQLSMCMQIDNIIGNQVTLRNCGKGVIENKSLVVMMDDIALGANTQTIQEGNSSVVNVSGLWNIPFGKHSLKISNGAAVAQNLVDVQPNRDGLVGSWGFDEGTGAIAYDNSGNGNVGALTNMNTTGNATSGWAEGRFGSGLLFDGTNDYIDAGNASSLNITNAITMGVWIKGNTPSKTEFIVSKRAGSESWHITTTTDHKIYFAIYQSDTSYKQTITTSSISTDWNHIVAVADGSFVRLYINGIEASTPTAYDGTIHSTTQSVKIGWANSVGYFNGTIDEVRVWSRALAPDDTVAMKQIL
ncbi:MAG: LamG domain-containing protein [Candidatus Aenigmatarchaeota archaeon]